MFVCGKKGNVGDIGRKVFHFLVKKLPESEMGKRRRKILYFLVKIISKSKVG